MIADGSMALWCTPRGDAPRASAEVHFNYWRLEGHHKFSQSAPQRFWDRTAKMLRLEAKENARDFAEIGVLLRNPESVEEVCIFLPAHQSVWEFADCGPKFRETDIAQGIFNQLLTCTSKGKPGPEWVQLVKSDGAPLCRVHVFMLGDSGIDAEQLQVTAMAEGVALKITRRAIDSVCLGIPPNCPAYFRIRAFLHDPKACPFIQSFRPKDRFFQSGYNVVEYIDYRLNEARTLPSQVESAMSPVPSNRRVPITLVAFLTAAPVQYDLTASNEQTHKKRLLEQEIWRDYVPGGIPPGMIVYHWKKEAPGGKEIEDFSAFVKMETRHSGFKILLCYLIIAFAFGVFGNLAASAIWDRMGEARTTSCGADCSPSTNSKVPDKPSSEKP